MATPAAPITRINEFQAAQGKADELLALLRSVVPHIEGSDGNLGCEVLRGVEDAGAIVVVERWRSVDDHRASVASFPKEQMQAAMPLLAGPPKGAYYQV